MSEQEPTSDDDELRARLRAELASLQQVEAALSVELMRTRTPQAGDELMQLQIDIALTEQRVTGLEIMLAKHRVTHRVDPEPSKRRIFRRAPRTTTDAIDRSQLRFGSVFLPDGGSAGEGRQSSVEIGATTLPLLQVPGIVYLPSLRLQVTNDLIVPEEVLHDPYTLEWVLATYPGDAVNDIVADLDEDVCILSNPYSFAFGHWMSEDLIKVFVLEAAGFRGSYVVTPAHPGGPIPGFVTESLALLGVGADRIITELTGATRFRSAMFTPPINRDRAQSLEAVYLAYRQHVIERVEVPAPAPTRRIWQIRNASVGSGRKSLVNEDEIFALLVAHGFEFVDMGALSLSDQIAVASTAQVMGGPHGSGFIHTLFQPPGSTLIECFSPHFINTCFLELCAMLGHRYHMLVQQCAYDDYPWGLELKIDPVHLSVVLDSLGPTGR